MNMEKAVKYTRTPSGCITILRLMLHTNHLGLANP